MKFILLSIALFAVAVSSATAQQSPPGGKTLAATMDVYVFPSDGQESEQQSKDEASCYSWAQSNTGTDPFELTKASAAQAQDTENAQKAAAQAGQGAGAAGAVKGAAVGALVGEIAGNDVGNSAGWGAAAGLIHGRRKAHEAQNQAQAQAQQQGQQQQQATQEQIGNFKKAFSVCLEAKEYMVKY